MRRRYRVMIGCTTHPSLPVVTPSRRPISLPAVGVYIWLTHLPWKQSCPADDTFEYLLR